MVPAAARRVPLVRRPKALASPLDERIAHLTGLAAVPADAGHHDLVARASGVLNYAALIASDAGMPGLAADLCWRQHRIFADAGTLSGGTAVMALMPLVNISRLLTREGDGEAAYDLLARLYRAARQRGSTDLHGNPVDLSGLTGTEEDHRRVCEELWGALLTDGARALARVGRWAEAAEALAAHRGIGNRLLDGRQISVMALLERGLPQRARALIDSTTPAEPWETAVAALLRLCCRPPAQPVPGQELARALGQARTLIARHDPTVAVFQVRVGLTALELAHDRPGPDVASLLGAVADTAGLDARSARDVLNHPAGAGLSGEQSRRLKAVLAASGLGAGSLPPAHTRALTTAVDGAEAALRGLL